MKIDETGIVMDEDGPWVSDPHQVDEIQLILAGPAGVNHVGFQDGQWFRLTQHGGAQPISAADAILLRPADIDQVTKSPACGRSLIQAIHGQHS